MNIDYSFLRRVLFFVSRTLSKEVGYNEMPLISHSYAVGLQLMNNGITKNAVIASGFLHDIQEYSDISPYVIYKKFGQEVALLAFQLPESRFSKKNNINLDRFKIEFMKEYANGDAVLIALVDSIEHISELKTEIKTGLIYDMSRKETYYSGMLAAYEGRKESINDPIFDKLLLQYRNLVSELWS